MPRKSRWLIAVRVSTLRSSSVSTIGVGGFRYGSVLVETKNSRSRK